MAFTRDPDDPSGAGPASTEVGANPSPLTDMLDLLGVADDEHLGVLERRPRAKQPGGYQRTARSLRNQNPLPQWDYWVGLCPVRKVVKGRGGIADVTRLTALWADLDVKGDGLPDMDTCWAVVATLTDWLGSPPSWVTLSGHGLQPVWVIEGGGVTDMDLAGSLLSRWGGLVQRTARAYKGAADGVFNLDRVLRVPGTLNLHKNPEAPIPVAVEWKGGSVSAQRLQEALDASEGAQEAAESPQEVLEAPEEPQPAQEAAEDPYAAQAAQDLDWWADRLAAMPPKSGRNNALLDVAKMAGEWAALGLLDEAQVADTLLAACEANGLMAEDGAAQCQATIRSGLDIATADPNPLPPLIPLVIVVDVEHTVAGGRLLGRDDLAGLPPVRPFIEGVLSRPSAAVLVGPFGSYKSFLALSWALSSAAGIPWLGRATVPTKVLYVVGEGAAGLHARIRAWEVAYNWGEPVPADRFQVLVQPWTLADRRTWAAIGQHAAEGGHGFIIMDTLSSLAPDADETKQSAQVMRWLSDLASLIDGPAVLVHHPGHADQTRPRGGYQFGGNADEVMLMASVKDSPVASLTLTKVKEGEAGRVLWMRAQRAEDSLVLATADPSLASVPLRERVMALLAGAEGEGMTTKGLMVGLGLADTQRSSLTQALRAMRSEGQVITCGSGRSTRHYLAGHEPC